MMMKFRGRDLYLNVESELRLGLEHMRGENEKIHITVKLTTCIWKGSGSNLGNFTAYK